MRRNLHFVMNVESQAKAPGGIKSLFWKDLATLWRMDWGGREAGFSPLFRRLLQSSIQETMGPEPPLSTHCGHCLCPA